MRGLGLNVEVQADHFPDDAGDVDILALCGVNGWVYVAQDFEVRRNPAELAALQAAGVHAIFLHGRQQRAEYAIANFRAAVRRILKLFEEAEGPIHLAVMAGGRIKIHNEPTTRE
jgi:hypothetical protein